jgi:predicted NUDIX family NTP pyrophosphohydrolase
MPKRSAGIVLYRLKNGELEIFLVHPGGPFWINKDAGAWSIPKGEIEEGEDPLAVAVREFKEETGQQITGDFEQLQPVKQKAGKIITAWAVKGNVDENRIISNTFEIEWPPKSGKMRAFPEIDKAEWFGISDARDKINPGQVGLLDELTHKLKLKK